MKYVFNSLKEFFKGLQVELKLFRTDKAYRKELFKYLTSKEYLKLALYVILMGISHGVILAMIQII